MNGMRRKTDRFKWILMLIGGVCLVSCQSEFDKLEDNAQQGDAAAQVKLGIMYYQGDGVEQDSEKAARWFQKAAEQENATAFYHIGVLYLNGEGVSQDTPKALESFKKAGNLGERNALKTLCSIYHEGKHGVAPDEQAALNWCRKASEQGDAASKETFAALSQRIRQREEAERARQAARQRCLLNCDTTYSPCERIDLWCLLFEGELDPDTSEYRETQDYQDCLEDLACGRYKTEWQTCRRQCQ